MAPASPWVINAQKQDGHAPFWLAIDPYSDGGRYLVTIERASLGKLARRPAPPHPGQIDRPVPVGIRVRSTEGCVFEAIGP